MKTVAFVILLTLSSGCTWISEELMGHPRTYGPHAENVLPAAPRTQRTAFVWTNRVIHPPKDATMSWAFPAARQTPDLVFKVYHSAALTAPLRTWPLFAAVPGASRSLSIRPDQLQDFFVLTASNYLGESSYATR